MTIYIHPIYVSTFFGPCTYSRRFVCIVMNREETYPRKFELCVCVQLRKIMYGIINFHNYHTSMLTLLSSCSTLIATDMLWERSECIVVRSPAHHAGDPGWFDPRHRRTFLVSLYTSDTNTVIQIIFVNRYGNQSLSSASDTGRCRCSSVDDNHIA